MSTGSFEEIIEYYKSVQYQYEQFRIAVVAHFSHHPQLISGDLPVLHSIKSRLKDSEHLRDKLHRMLKRGELVSKETLQQKISDLCGIRILHLYQDQFKIIHSIVVEKINIGDWKFVEEPKAYTWDPESEAIYNELKIKTERKDSYYTSVHYIVKPNNDLNLVRCEIQVRTLFEEVWGEIDHSINYPHPTDSLSCKEQLRVLSKLVSTGTRLGDSIFRSFNEHKQRVPIRAEQGVG